MPNVDFQLEAIPAGLRFPVGSFAEWNALLQNVLTNAWNAMLETDRPKIHVQGGKSGKSKEWLRISDTGTGLAIPRGRIGCSSLSNAVSKFPRTFARLQ
jgi:hypothetical protein